MRQITVEEVLEQQFAEEVANVFWNLYAEVHGD